MKFRFHCPYKRLYWNTATPIHWRIICGCFYITTEKLSNSKSPHHEQGWHYLLSGWPLQNFARLSLLSKNNSYITVLAAVSLLFLATWKSAPVSLPFPSSPQHIKWSGHHMGQVSSVAASYDKYLPIFRVWRAGGGKYICSSSPRLTHLAHVTWSL